VLTSVEETIPAERVVLLGFSQGACLTLEFAARHARRYGGVIGLSGGLIGPDGTPRDYPGDFGGAPTFLGCSDVDPHIPKERVIASGDVFERMGANVTVRLYPAMAHTVNEDEIRTVNQVIKALPEF
jgi:phospholipase/carboxylesterase